jgi:uncharacterized paraquat-inducible protein A
MEALLVNGEAQNFKAADWCIESVPKPALTALFFVFFIVISALVMLSLFVGAVSMGMAEAVQEMKDMDYQSVSGCQASFIARSPNICNSSILFVLLVNNSLMTTQFRTG